MNYDAFLQLVNFGWNKDGDLFLQMVVFGLNYLFLVAPDGQVDVEVLDDGEVYEV